MENTSLRSAGTSWYTSVETQLVPKNDDSHNTYIFRRQKGGGERGFIERELFRPLRRRHPLLLTFCSSLFVHTVPSIDRGAPLNQMYTQYALKYMLGSALFCELRFVIMCPSEVLPPARGHTYTISLSLSLLCHLRGRTVAVSQCAVG